MRRWAEFVAATTLLTRLPVGRWAAVHPPAAACVWAYPFVGALVGGMGAAALAACLKMGLPQVVAAAWAIATTMSITGGLHEDGLSDTADGFGGGSTIERKLAIMRDSRIGSFGALALAFSLLLRILCLGASPHPVFALLWASVLGRGMMLLPVVMLKPARSDGLGPSLVQTKPSKAVVGLGVTFLVSLTAPRAGLVALATALVSTTLMRRQISGYTGDTLGSTEQAVECTVLTALSV